MQHSTGMQAHPHTHITKFLKKRLGGVTRPHDFQRGHLWSCVTKKHPCKDLFSLDLGNICLPACLGRCMMQSRGDVVFFLKKLHRELWLGHLGGQGKSQANMSASHTDSGRSTSFFLYARITCVHVLGKAVQQEQ